MPAPFRNRQPGGYTPAPQLPNRPLTHRKRQPIVTVAVHDKGRRRIVAGPDLPQRADGLDLRGGRRGRVFPVRRVVRGRDAPLGRETVDEDGDRLGVPAHVQDDLGAVVFQGQRKGHGSLVADGSVFHDLGCTGQSSRSCLGDCRGEDTYGAFSNAGQDVRYFCWFFFGSQGIARFMPVWFQMSAGFSLPKESVQCKRSRSDSISLGGYSANMAAGALVPLAGAV